jgi:hypothetical protein
MATGRVPTTANSPLTAKGDLFGYSTTQARVAVGNNGETLVADSSATTGLRYQTAYNGNAVINGGFDIWQRGTSFTAASVYTADRWFAGSQTTYTRSRQASGLTGIQYAMRVQRDSGSTNTSGGAIYYNLESADSYRFAGQTVTVSFYAKAGATYSPTSSALNYILYTGTGTDQRRDQSTGFTGETTVVNSSVTLTTSYQRFSYTVAIGASATEIALGFFSVNSGTAGANDWYEITGIQLEVGSVATTFKRSNGAGGTIQGELAACQRYYIRYNGAIQYAVLSPTGIAKSTTAGQIPFSAPVPMRVKPSSLDYGPALSDFWFTSLTNDVVPTAIALDASLSTTNFPVVNVTVASGLTAATPRLLMAATSNSPYLGFSAEL